MSGTSWLERAADDVARPIVEDDLYAAALVGHGMGAQIAELVAARLPDRTAALVLITPTPLAGNTLPEDVRTLLRNCGAMRPPNGQSAGCSRASSPSIS